MYTLVFDTTGTACAIALFEEKAIVAQFSKSLEFGQAEELIPGIKNMLEQKGADFNSIEAVVVCVGPGSFTGVRSSIAAAKAFLVAKKDLKLTGVSAFEAYLASLKKDELADLNAVVIETKRADFYCQIFDKDLQKISDPMALPKEEIIKKLKGKRVSIIGDGVERFLFEPTGLDIKTIKIFEHLNIEDLGLCGIKKLKEKAPEFPKPLYLRAPDVCVKQP